MNLVKVLGNTRKCLTLSFDPDLVQTNTCPSTHYTFVQLFANPNWSSKDKELNESEFDLKYHLDIK